MPAKPPKRRLAVRRSSHNAKRRLISSPIEPSVAQSLSAHISFEGSGKHKLKPRAFGLEPGASDADDTYCDGHADFSPEDVRRVPELIRRGIRASLLDGRASQEDPLLFWTVDDNGWIYEFKLTNPGQGVYHGYPMLPTDPLAKTLIRRYDDWVHGQDDPTLAGSLAAALERYQ
jgi:hypothetical protein